MMTMMMKILQRAREPTMTIMPEDYRPHDNDLMMMDGTVLMMV